ncbi:MAG: MBL fold metallo-hydrolase [Sporichthyaceae bacterium]|nr:MBL fold metallo-hydrolase [Sporichthyaceae bacterium]
MTDKPRESNATVVVLAAGYVGDRVASTVGLISDGDAVVVVDPGMVANRSVIIDPLEQLGIDPAAVTDVVFSHHHPDHTINAALFPNARIHDHWAIYTGDIWDSRDAEGYEISPSIKLIRTPGHSAEDITTLAGTPEGVVAFTHVWWTATIPDEDPYAIDAGMLRASRKRVLDVADQVVPGHGPLFVPDESTPR